MAPRIVYERYGGSSFMEALLRPAAELFSAHYGIWGRNAPNYTGPICVPGQRVRMSVAYLRSAIVPMAVISDCHHIRAIIDGVLVGNVFACQWEVEGRTVLWVTQLVVHKAYRSRGIATMLLKLLITRQYDVYGIASSHAHACMAAVHAFSSHYSPRRLVFVGSF